MNFRPNDEVAKAGTYLYDGTVICDVRIVRSMIYYGSGDYEDPPEIADDQERETFYIQYGSTIERGNYSAGGGAYPTLCEAVAAVENAPGFGKSVRWND